MKWTKIFGVAAVVVVSFAGTVQVDAGRLGTSNLRKHSFKRPIGLYGTRLLYELKMRVKSCLPARHLLW